MKGMIGIIVNKGQLLNTAAILGQVGTDKYLCRFMNEPQFQRVVSVEDIQHWILFADEAEMNTWIEANKDPAAMAKVNGEEPADDPNEGKVPRDEYPH